MKTGGERPPALVPGDPIHGSLEQVLHTHFKKMYDQLAEVYEVCVFCSLPIRDPPPGGSSAPTLVTYS